MRSHTDPLRTADAVSHLRFGIVADDFTSAMDGAGPFVASGAVEQAQIVVGERQELGEGELVAIDADSRNRSAAEASALVARAVARVRDAPMLLKTVDSTLRGHVREELDAAWRVSKRRRVVFAPAFPAEGRTTVHGVQLLDGVDVASTTFGADPRHPIESAAIGSILAPLSCAFWQGGDQPMPKAALVVADATSDRDLDRLVELTETPEDVLWVGSPGLAAALARHHAVPGRRRRTNGAAVRRLAVVVGSSHPINELQLSRLRERLDGRLRSVDEAVEAGDCEVAVLAAVRPTGRVSDAAASRHRTMLADRACALVRAGFDGLIVTGGETARAVISHLGDPDIIVIDEPSSGVVVARLSSTPPVTIVTKAGGFGGPDTLIELHQQLTGTAV